MHDQKLSNVNRDPALAGAVPEIPSTAGMTVKVVKGSIWTMAGQVAPMAISLGVTKFMIPILGVKGYGVLMLLALIPNYFLFADFGMSMASTKYGSEAFAKGDLETEGRVIRTAAFIALVTSVPIAGLLFLLSSPILDIFFEVPDFLHGETVIGLRIVSLTLLINFQCNIFNTPQLARLRMDLNTLINAGSRIAGLIATPIVIYLGYGIVGAVTVLLIASVINLTGHLMISRGLLKNLLSFSIDRDQFRPLLKFGGGLMAASILGLLLGNIERGILPKLVSLEALAFYTLASTIIAMMTLFSNSMIQSLIPAFARLQTDDDRVPFHGLYSRGIRLALIVLAPSVAFFLITAKPFFTWWASSEASGMESSRIFYVLLLGLVFNVPAYLPYAVLMASGRTDIFAKLFLIELVPYIALIVLLTIWYGAAGAAAAWSIRAIIEAVIWFLLARRVSGIPFSNVKLPSFALATLVLVVPVLINIYYGGLNAWVVSSFVLASISYLLILRLLVLTNEELGWISERVVMFLPRFRK